MATRVWDPIEEGAQGVKGDSHEGSRKEAPLDRLHEWNTEETGQRSPSQTVSAMQAGGGHLQFSSRAVPSPPTTSHVDGSGNGTDRLHSPPGGYKLVAATALMYCMLVFMMGVQVGSFGPALVDIADNTGESLQVTAYATSFRTIASTIASLSGPVLFNRYISGHRLLAVGCVICFIGNVIIPTARALGLLYFAMALQGIAGGVLDVGLNLFMIWLFAGNKAGGPWMQAMHFSFSIGATLASLAVGSATSAADKPASSQGNATSTVVTQPESGHIHASLFVYYGLAALAFATAVVLLWLPTPRKPEEGEAAPCNDAAPLQAETTPVDINPLGPDEGRSFYPNDQTNARGGGNRPAALPKLEMANSIGRRGLCSWVTRKLRIITLGAVITALYVGCEHIFGNYLTAYTSTVLHIPEEDGQFITAAYWAAITAGRFLSIWAAMFLAPALILTIAIAGSALFAALMLFATDSLPLLWVVAIGFGVCMAPQVPSTFALIGSYFTLSPRDTTVLSLANSFGAWLLPFAVASTMGGISASTAGSAEIKPFSVAFRGITIAASALNLAILYLLTREGALLRKASVAGPQARSPP